MVTSQVDCVAFEYAQLLRWFFSLCWCLQNNY